jgi:hypothetical protein
MADKMTFPATFKEFAEQYKIVDKEEVYTNGAELIPIFRIEQWLDNENNSAKKIFEEIEKKIDLELSIIRKIIHAKGGRANGKTVLFGKIQMLIDLKNFIAELKKKYTQEK